MRISCDVRQFICSRNLLRSFDLCRVYERQWRVVLDKFRYVLLVVEMTQHYLELTCISLLSTIAFQYYGVSPDVL